MVIYCTCVFKFGSESTVQERNSREAPREFVS
jgi:hypothetical protein